MAKLTSEAKVGIFVFIGIVLLVYMSLKVGGMRFGREEGYKLFVKIESAAGLDKDASVTVAGVEVGRIKEIFLEGYKAKLVLLIKPDVKIGRDSTAILKTSGLLGEKYLELTPGSPNAPALEEGEEITRVVTYADMDELITDLADIAEDIKLVSKSLGRVLGGEEGETTLRNIVENLEEITTGINRIVKNNDEKFDNVMTNMEEFSVTIKDVSKKISEVISENRGGFKEGIENLRTASRKLEEAMDTLNKMGPQMKDTVGSLESISRKLDTGQGTLGKLINDTAVHDKLDKTLAGINNYIERSERFRTYISYRGEYIFDAKEVKSYFSLKIQPKADKYYLVEIIDDPRGLRKFKTVEAPPAPPAEVITTSDAIKFSAEIAKRFGDVVVRGGIIESTGGAGVDYYLFKDKVKIAFDAFDFDKDRGPHLKVGAVIRLGKYFFITGGYDDFASKVDLASAYVGAGFEFDDEDLKYVFSSTPPIKF